MASIHRYMELTGLFKGFFFETSSCWKIGLWATLELLSQSDAVGKHSPGLQYRLIHISWRVGSA